MSNSAKYNWEKTKCANTADFFTGYEYTSTDTAVSSYTQVPYNVDSFYTTRNQTVSLKLKPGARIQQHNPATVGTGSIRILGVYPFTTKESTLIGCGGGYDVAKYLTGNMELPTDGFLIWSYPY